MARCCEMLLCEVPTASTMSWTQTSRSPTTQRIFSRSGCEMALRARAAISICSRLVIISWMTSLSMPDSGYTEYYRILLYYGATDWPYHWRFFRHCLDHEDNRPAAPRRIRLEQGEPLYRMDRRRADRDRFRRSPGRRAAPQGQGIRFRCRLYLGAEPGDQDLVDRSRRDGPDVDSDPAFVALERTPLRRLAGSQQGRDGRKVR